MTHQRIWMVATTMAVVALAAGCGDDDDDSAGQQPATAGPTASAPRIDPAAFATSTTIDNPLYPLPVGARWVYEAQTEDGTERVEVVVTPETKVVDGVTCVVVRDTARLDGEVIEDTFDWFAQDAEGTVWYFGEDTTEFEDGKPDNTEGSWEAGVDGAEPGIVMKARPTVGDTYRQEYYAGEAEDEAEVLRTGDRLQIPFGSFDGVLVTKDFTKLEPDADEHKFYAPGVGLVQAVSLDSGDKEVLVEMTR